MPEESDYPEFSCRYFCPFASGGYCSEGCYAIDGLDLAGNPYPPKLDTSTGVC